MEASVENSDPPQGSDLYNILTSGPDEAIYYAITMGQWTSL